MSIIIRDLSVNFTLKSVTLKEFIVQFTDLNEKFMQNLQLKVLNSH